MNIDSAFGMFLEFLAFLGILMIVIFVPICLLNACWQFHFTGYIQ